MTSVLADARASERRAILVDNVYVRRVVATVLAALFLLAGAAHAQAVCTEELQAARPQDAPPVRVATALARTALEVIEPALPASRSASREWDDPHAEFLQRRGYLPEGWDEEAELTGERWAALLARLQTPYHVEPLDLSGETDPETLAEETGRVLDEVASAVRPLALIGTAPGDRQTVVFAGVIWNWTPYPRLLIFDPADLTFGSDGEIGSVLTDLGTCAWQPRAYLATDAETAAGYYLGSTEAEMRLLATDRGHVGEMVPAEQERATLAYDTEPLQGARVASIGFTGPGPSVGQVAGLLASVRTNLGVFEMGHYLAFP